MKIRKILLIIDAILVIAIILSAGVLFDSVI
jgi:hypothetical protein